MATEIVTVERGSEIQQAPTSLLATIAAAAADPSVNVEKMEALVRLELMIRAEQAKVAYNQALNRLQARLPRISKDGVIVNHKTGAVQSRYSKYEDIDAAVRPLMIEEGFAISFDSRREGELMVISADLRHIMGHSETKCIPLGIDNSGSKNSTQGHASTVSYGKRHLLKMHLNIVEEGEDNDGRGDDSPITEQQAHTIQQRILETNTDRARFLKVFRIDGLSDLKRRDYQRAIDLLAYKGAR